MSPEFSECLTKAIAGDLAKKESEANKSMRMLEMVGDRARNYTCADPEMDTTNTSLSKMSWVDPEGGGTYNAQVRGAAVGARAAWGLDLVAMHCGPHLCVFGFRFGFRPKTLTFLVLFDPAGQTLVCVCFFWGGVSCLHGRRA